jgi:DNA-binding MurR/RpiR family transcriptional regulator
VEFLNGIEVGPVLVSERRSRPRPDGERGSGWDDFEMDMAGLKSVYDLRSTPVWTAAVDATCTAAKVHVVGFQTIARIASGIAARLDYLRDGAAVEDDGDGILGAIFGAPAISHCIVLFEMRYYTKMSLALASAAHNEGVPLIVIGDTYCYWAREIPTWFYRYAPTRGCSGARKYRFSCLRTLMLDDVTAQRGGKVSKRQDHMRKLWDHFDVFKD